MFTRALAKDYAIHFIFIMDPYNNPDAHLLTIPNTVGSA